MATQSSKTSKSPSRYSVGMFSAGEARCDRWQSLAHAAQTLVAQVSSGSPSKATLAEVEGLLAPLSMFETFRAYPGEAMMNALKDALGRSDYSSFSRLTNRIAKAIITGSYRRSGNAWKLGEEGETELNDRLRGRSRDASPIPARRRRDACVAASDKAARRGSARSRAALVRAVHWDWIS
jgi:hypothetical protein